MMMIVMTPDEAMTVQQATAGKSHQLAPRYIEAGEYAGQSALPARVLEDDAHKAVRSILQQYPIVDLDPADAWPVVED